MHLEFLQHGKGWARAAVDYLVGEWDAGRQRRESVEYCAAIRSMVAAVADSLDSERKNTSAVTA